MAKSIKKWLENNKKDIKKVIIGGIIFSPCVLLVEPFSIGAIINGFIAGVFTTGIILWNYHFFKKFYLRGF